MTPAHESKVLAASPALTGTALLTGALAAGRLTSTMMVSAIGLLVTVFPEELTADTAQSLLSSPRRMPFAVHAKNRSDVYAVAVCTAHANETISLTYLAVHPSRRSRGLGSTLLRYVLSQPFANRGMVCEVAAPESDLDRARLRFYRSAGAVTIDRRFDSYALWLPPRVIASMPPTDGPSNPGM